MCSESASDTAIDVQGLSKTYQLYDRPRDRLLQFLMRGRKTFFRRFPALKDVSFTVRRGETLGIVGHNGSGKSTLLQILCGTLQADSGSMEIKGRISALLELGAGFNPEFTGEENVYLNGAVLGMDKDTITEKYDAICDFAGIGDFIGQPVKTYSSGMVVRLAFAIAVAADPDILIVDEALSVGDEAFQSKCFARIRQIQQRGGTILFVTHSMPTIVELCDRVLLLDEGESLKIGEPKHIVGHYHRLIHATPERREILRKQIRQNKYQPPQVSEGGVCAPESQIIYPSEGATIANPRIETEDGNGITTLETGKGYLFCYDVAIQQQAENIAVAMMIKTITGIELGGKNIPLPQPYDPTSSQRTLSSPITVRLAFTCHLAKGCYYINAGVSSVDKNGNLRYLHRIMDAVEFHVLKKNVPPVVSMVDFEIRLG